MNARWRDERGLTLTEVMIVAAIGLLVLLGLGGFYLNSQATWLDASSKTITQREATLVTEAIVDRVRTSNEVRVNLIPDAEHVQLELYNAPGAPAAAWIFWFDPTDSLIHQGTSMVSDDRGAMHASKVTRFRVTAGDSALAVITLRLRAATGQQVELSTSALLRNR